MTESKVDSAKRRCKLKTMSEAELRESYKGQDIIRNVGIKEDQSRDNKVSESYSQSTQTVLQLAGRENGRESCSTGHFNCPSSAKPQPEQKAPNQCQIS